MTHGLTDQEWMDYFDGVLEPEARDRLEAHLIGCELCWDFYDRMAGTGERLQAAAERARESVPLSDPEMYHALGVTLRRTRGNTSSAIAIRERLDDLEAVMTTMCGARTTTNAFDAAARSSTARSLEGVTPDNWASFLKSLTSIAIVMCGETGADLVWETGSTFGSSEY
jgi:predicted anti-sigma-YlaC factor YlaD